MRLSAQADVPASSSLPITSFLRRRPGTIYPQKCAGSELFFAFDNGSRPSAPLMTAMPVTKVPRNTLAPPPALGSVIVCSVACGMYNFYLK